MLSISAKFTEKDLHCKVVILYQITVSRNKRFKTLEMLGVAVRAK